MLGGTNGTRSTLPLTMIVQALFHNAYLKGALNSKIASIVMKVGGLFQTTRIGVLAGQLHIRYVGI
jgi:hypothetical protein